MTPDAVKMAPEKRWGWFSREALLASATVVTVEE
jgi:hypothetical protein